MFAPRSAAGYGSFQISPQPASGVSGRSRTRSTSIPSSARMAGKYNARMGFLSGKKILVTGLLSNRSIAYGIARAARREGAELAFTYVGDRFKDRVSGLAREFGSDIVLPCDVASDEQITGLFEALGKRWDGLDGLVHAIGFAPREAIAGSLLDGLSRESLRIAH